MLDPQRSDATYARYNTIAIQFIRQYARESGRNDLHYVQSEELSVSAVRWFLGPDSNERWAPPYIRQVAAALRQHIEFLCGVDLIEAKTGQTLLEALEKQRPGPKATKRKRRAGKSIKVYHLRRLIRFFIDQGESDDLSRWIAGYIQVGSRIGWRPGELVNMWLDGNYLCAVAEKNTNGRGLCATCEIGLHEYGPELIGKLGAWISETQRWVEEYGGRANLLGVVAIRIKRGCSKLRIPHIYPYTLRHHAIATMKMSGYTREEIAVIVNHAGTRTATESYGKGRTGTKRARKRFRIDPWRLTLVRNTARGFHDSNKQLTLS